MKYVKFRDIIACFIFLFMLPIALIAKIFIRNFWLVGEEKREARDNGYWFFKYVRENHPEQKIAYVIDKNCADYEKVKDLGKIVQWGGISHWFWYLVAKKNISSQKGCKPNAAACYLFEVILKIWRNKRYFLQHGITINDGKWLYYKNCRFQLFVCGAKPEFEFIKEKFGYPENRVQLLGFCRFDNLHANTQKKKQILIMPTWRGYLVRACKGETQANLSAKFKQSDYFKKWSELLCSDKLTELLDKTGYSVLFYPHRNMQIYIEDFKSLNLSEKITIADADKCTVQQALMESACLLTDYSSVFFDFAYMKKPIIFYQFDEVEFRANQYKEGYFDYHDNPLGSWSGTLNDCLTLLEKASENGFAENDRAEEFFEYSDGNNCYRNYVAVRDK